MSTPTKSNNRERMAALFPRYLALNLEQRSSFGAFMFGSCEAMATDDYCRPNPDRIVDAVERAIVSAEANMKEDGK